MISVVFLLCGLLPAVSTSYINDYDKPFVFQCPTGQSISNIRSQHSNHYEDRRYGFSCKNTPGLGSCQWHGYANNFDEPVLFQCPGNGVISGMNSYHDNNPEDRRFKFYCCDFQVKVMTLCAFSDYANGFDALIDFYVHSNQFLKGVFSYHHNGAEDRRYKFETCLAN